MSQKGASPQRYEFVSGLDKSYPAHIRAHVLQRHMRQRHENVAKSIRFNSTRGSSSTRQHVLRSRGSERTEQNNPSASTNTSCSQKIAANDSRDDQLSYLASASAAAPAAAMTEATNALEKPLHSADPALSCSILSNSTLSSCFGTLPVQLSHRDQFFVHHCRLPRSFPLSHALLGILNYFLCKVVTSLSSPLYQLDSADVKFNPPRDISFRQIHYDEAGLLAMATAAACEVAQLTGGRRSLEMAQYQLRSISLLSRRLVDPLICAHDMTILLVMSFISAECEAFLEVRC